MRKKKTNERVKPHGCVFDNNGYWYVAVRLPADTKRRKYPLCAPNSPTAMKSDRPKELAIEAASRLWEEACAAQRVAPTDARTVDDVCSAYLDYAAVYYHGGHELSTVTCALRVFRALYGRRPIGDIVHTDLLQAREALVRKGLARVTVNRYIGVITNRLAPWAFDTGIIRAATKAELTPVSPLKANRCAARECAPVRPVADDIVDKTLACLPPNLAAMVRVQRLTGMRPAEVCQLNWPAIDTSTIPWVYRPEHHKNEWRGQPRAVCIGPRARAILRQYTSTKYPFSPLAAIAERLAARGHKEITDAPLGRRVGERWTREAYTRAINRACARAGVESWAPNRLRHAFATEVRRAFGVDAARAVLGHSTGAKITDRYSFEAAIDEAVKLATPAVESLG